MMASCWSKAHSSPFLRRALGETSVPASAKAAACYDHAREGAGRHNSTDQKRCARKLVTGFAVACTWHRSCFRQRLFDDGHDNRDIV